MSKPRKDAVPRTFRIRKSVLERLNKYSEKTSIPMTAIVDKALEKYLDEIETKE